MKLSIFSLLVLGSTFARGQDQIDCSEAYSKTKAVCIRVTCDEKYKTFIGTWNGPFESYSRELSTEEKEVFRPFDNTVTYSESDCWQSVENGDTFIIGRRIDEYPAFSTLPAKKETGLLITGKHADGSPFLRTVGPEGTYDYVLVYQHKPANMSVWSLTIPASTEGPEMTFTTIDAQDFTNSTAHKRNVVVTMSVGPMDRPAWQGVVSKGYHSLRK
jgi:hypothetical protein